MMRNCNKYYTNYTACRCKKVVKSFILISNYSIAKKNNYLCV